MGAQSQAEARMFTLALPKAVLIAELCPAAPGTFSTGLFDKKKSGDGARQADACILDAETAV